ncbi:MAG: C-terminal binding protein [Verrucomicrobia bacterium]|nr:MAG: C-terminal binding protein [Verrucomicrobiota bacterium]
MNARAKVVVTDFLAEPAECERRILGDIADVVMLDAKGETDLVGRIEDADAIMMYHVIRIGERTIDALRHCKLIVRCGVGFDNVDGAAARRRGIPVANVPDYGTEDVADSAIGMSLALGRGIHFLNSRLRRGEGPWTYRQAQPVARLRGRTFGIIGLGRIGTAAALRAKALGMKVVFYDPYLPDGYDKSLGVTRVETLDELLRDAHVVSPHCPLTPETRHIMNRDTIARMPRGSILVNTSRGAVVDPLAVLDALSSGHLAGAGIDVLEFEPPSPDHPLLLAWRDPGHPAHDRLILNPHSAFYSEEGLVDMRVKGSENCRRALLGTVPRNIVNG